MHHQNNIRKPAEFLVWITLRMENDYFVFLCGHFDFIYIIDFSRPSAPLALGIVNNYPAVIQHGAANHRQTGGTILQILGSLRWFAEYQQRRSYDYRYSSLWMFYDPCFCEYEKSHNAQDDNPSERAQICFPITEWPQVLPRDNLAAFALPGYDFFPAPFALSPADLFASPVSRVQIRKPSKSLEWLPVQFPLSCRPIRTEHILNKYALTERTCAAFDPLQKIIP